MSVRNSYKNKALRRTDRLNAKAAVAQYTYVDLLAWIKTRVHVSSGKARAIATSGSLKVGDDTIGRVKVGGHYVFNRYVLTDIAGIGGVNIRVDSQNLDKIQNQVEEAEAKLRAADAAS